MTNDTEQQNVTRIHRGTVTWLNISKPTNEQLSELEDKYSFHPVHLAESIQRVQHTEVEHEEAYLFFVLHVPVIERTSGKVLISQLGVFLGKDYLVTVHNHDIPAIKQLMNQSEAHDLSDVLRNNSSYLLHLLIAGVLEDMSHMIDAVMHELDDIEDVVFADDGSDAQMIGKLRQKIVRLRRIIGSNKIILTDLTDQIDTFAGENMARYYSNNTKMSNKLWELIEEARDTVEIYKDADFTTSTEHTNRTLMILTLLFTFTLPITVLGTLYGTNLVLPGGIEAEAWSFLGRYTTFGLLVGASVSVAVGMYLYFKSKKWF
jgi:magnesium transporter